MQEMIASLKIIAAHHLKLALDAKQQACMLLENGLLDMAEIWTGMHELHFSVYQEFVEMIREEEDKLSS